MKFRIIGLLYFSVFLLNGISCQKLSFGIGVTATQRGFYNFNGLSKENEKEIRRLEVPKASLIGNIEYLIFQNNKINLNLGLGYINCRYGARKYKIPVTIHNPTPQANFRKEEIYHNQGRLFFKIFLKNYNILKANSLFFGMGLIVNESTYRVHNVSSSLDQPRAFVGYTTSSGFKLHKWDANIELGLNYKLKRLFNEKFSIQPFFSLNLVPYKTQHYKYLYFDKPITGNLFYLGLNMNYIIL